MGKIFSASSLRFIFDQLVAVGEEHQQRRKNGNLVSVTGKPTIGYGHLVTDDELKAEKWKDGITDKEAEELLRKDIEKAEEAVNESVNVPLTQTQFDAIVDFVFNVGVGDKKKETGFKGSKFLEDLNKGVYNSNLMMNFKRPAIVIPRRQDQIYLFNCGDYVFRGIPI